jgi:hypothetical protein
MLHTLHLCQPAAAGVAVHCQPPALATAPRLTQVLFYCCPHIYTAATWQMLHTAVPLPRMVGASASFTASLYATAH